MKTRYAIEVIGNGNDKKFMIARIDGNCVMTLRKLGIFKSEQEAREIAEAFGYSIEIVGDIYQLLR